MFIYGSVDPCFSWEITSPRAGGSWQDVSKEGSLPPQLALSGDQGVAAGEALEEEELGPQVVLGTAALRGEPGRAPSPSPLSGSEPRRRLGTEK